MSLDAGPVGVKSAAAVWSASEVLLPLAGRMTEAMCGRSEAIACGWQKTDMRPSQG
jgi:hypothetical protein